MASIKECEDPDEKDARTEEFTWETSHENLPEKHGKQNAIQDMVENYDRRIMESVIVEKESRCPSGLLNPRWVGKLAWDFGVMFFVLMDAIVLPFQLTFKSNMDNDQMDTFDITWLWTTTLLFATDIILTFNTAVESAEQDGHFGNRRALNLDRCHIAKLYLRGWFVIDFGSTVPWAQISEAFYSGDSSQLTRLTKVVKFVRLLRLVRMLRLAKLRSIWERMEIRIGSVYIIQCISLLRVLSVVVAMCHWSACLFWLVGLPKNLFTELMSDEEKLGKKKGLTSHESYDMYIIWYDINIINLQVFNYDSSDAPLSHFVICFTSFDKGRRNVQYRHDFWQTKPACPVDINATAQRRVH